MIYLFTFLHIVVCLFLVVVVLLQSGKAADIAGAFGGMGSQTTFGPRGAATVLSKATTVAAGLFMLTSLTLAVLTTRNAGMGSSVLDRAGKPATKSAPAPAGKAPAVVPSTPAPNPVQPSTTPTSNQPMMEIIPEGATQGRKVPIDIGKDGKVTVKQPTTTQPAPAAPKQ